MIDKMAEELAKTLWDRTLLMDNSYKSFMESMVPLITAAFAQVRAEALDEAASIAGSYEKTYRMTKDENYKLTGKPFNPKDFYLDKTLSLFSESIKCLILAKKYKA